MIKVSVLVPIYNVAKFLPECLESLTNQTLKDIEIICINDGSTDESPKIIEKFAKKDPKIVVIDKKNSGYGDSMNQSSNPMTLLILTPAKSYINSPKSMMRILFAPIIIITQTRATQYITPLRTRNSITHKISTPTWQFFMMPQLSGPQSIARNS